MWRHDVLEYGGFPDVTMLTNTRYWVFEDVEQRDTFGLTTAVKQPGPVRFSGPFYNKETYDQYRKGSLGSDKIETTEFSSWSASGSFPLLPSFRSLEIMKKMLESPRLCDSTQFRFVPYRELTSKERGTVFSTDTVTHSGRIPVLKGESFDRWEPDAGEVYGSASLAEINSWMLDKCRSRNSTLHLIGARTVDDLPLRRPKIAYRKISRATDTLTLRFCLLPSEVANADPGQTLLRVVGDEADEAYLLALMNSMPLDWFARRWTDKHIGNDMLNRLPIPMADASDERRRRMTRLGAMLSVKDGRFAEWGASAAGVTVAESAAIDRDASIAEIDALAALLFGLTWASLREQFETFHHLPWQYESRLQQAESFYEKWSAGQELA